MRVIAFSRLLMSVTVPLVLFPLIFFIQLRIGYEVAMFPLYIIPVCKLTWELGWKGMVGAVLLAAFLWFQASSLSGQYYTSEWMRYYNAGVRAIVFLSSAVFILIFKSVVEQHQRRIEAMRALLNVCHGCGALQGSDGKWVPFDELSTASRVQTCECPRCTITRSCLSSSD